jgi:hypothetical protein
VARDPGDELIHRIVGGLIFISFLMMVWDGVKNAATEERRERCGDEAREPSDCDDRKGRLSRYGQGVRDYIHHGWQALCKLTPLRRLGGGS